MLPSKQTGGLDSLTATCSRAVLGRAAGGSPPLYLQSGIKIPAPTTVRGSAGRASHRVANGLTTGGSLPAWHTEHADLASGSNRLSPYRLPADQVYLDHRMFRTASHSRSRRWKSKGRETPWNEGWTATCPQITSFRDEIHNGPGCKSSTQTQSHPEWHGPRRATGSLSCLSPLPLLLQVRSG